MAFYFFIVITCPQSIHIASTMDISTHQAQKIILEIESSWKIVDKTNELFNNLNHPIKNMYIHKKKVCERMK